MTATTTTATALLSLLTMTTARAQCDRVWTTASSFHGVYQGTVHAIHIWDPDGAGPQPQRWIFGGEFATVGTSRAQNLVAHDPVAGTWSELGLPADAVVRAIATASNGDLVVGGDFTAIGGIAANRIARWDGSQWSALGSGTDAPVHALLRLQNGDLAVGGAFATAGGGTAARLARWTNAATWAPGLGGAGVGVNATVWALAQTANGHVYAGGDFTNLSPGGAMSRIARWNGTAWQALGTFSSGVSGPVHALTVSAAGELVVAGDFSTASGIPLTAGNLVRWNGSSFQNYGSGVGALLGNIVRAVACLPNGDVIVGGSFTTAGGNNSPNLARWVAANNSWSPTGMGADSEVLALLALPNGDTLAAGSFDTIGGVPALGLARRQLGAWAALAPNRGANNAIYALAKDLDGNLLIGGSGTTIDGVPMLGVARRTASGWQALGSILGVVRDIAVLPSGEVVAAGTTTTNTGFCARWTGSQWVNLGSFDAPVYCMIARADGSLVVGGLFQGVNATPARFLAHWSAGVWQTLGTLPTGPVRCLLELANGELAVGGLVGPAPPWPMFATWNGSTWSTQGVVVAGNAVEQILERRNGELVLAGTFFNVNGQAANGVASNPQGQWQPLGSLVAQGVSAIVELPDQQLLASRSLSGGPLQQWNGTSWQATGIVLQNAAEAMLYDGNQLLCAGSLSSVNGAVARNLEALGNTCAAIAVSAGSGCVGSNGTDTLTALTPPWIGAVFRASATGLPTFGLRVGVWGFSPASLPLALVLPMVAPGCTLLANPDVIEVFPLAGPTASTLLALPNDPALIGQLLHHQHVSIGLDPLLQATEVTATNALVLTVGTL